MFRHRTDASHLLTALVAALALGACGSDNKSNGTGTAAIQCVIDSDCSANQTCVSGTCTNGFSGGDVNTGGDAASDATGSDTASGTDAATSDDTSTTDTAVVNNGGSCGVCEKDSDCGSDFSCVPLLNSPPNFCVKKCTTNGDCSGGLICEQATTAAQKFCIPPTFKCQGCATTGCKADESCDFTSENPTCLKVGGACSSCQIPKDCADGMTCVKLGKDKVCAPACGSGGGTCPDKSLCVTFTAGISACSYSSSTCSYTGAPSAACAGCPDKCVAGACVECVKDDQCGTGGTCVPGTFTCAKDKCPDDKPQKLVTGVCVECTNDTHCAASSVGPKCVGNVCSAANQSNECAVCKDPYPGCVEINGNWSCVECATDADCAAKGKGTCSSKTFTCSATSSASGPTSGSCKSDADCPAGTTGFDLACDVGTGLCYDKAGQCDNLAAFCNAAKGSVCKPFDGLGLGGGGGLPQIPGLPGGGGSGPTTPGAGVCSCGSTGSSGSGWDDSLCKTLNLSSCQCDVDATSKGCDPFGLGSCCQQKGGGGGNPLGLLQCLQALQGGSADPACFGGASCLDMSCLTSAMGGGSSSSGGGGYCSAGGP